MATEAMVGNDIIMTVNVGTEAAPDYQPVAYQTEYSHESSREGIDVSHKGSDHAMTLPGREEGTISLSLRVLKPGTTNQTHQKLRQSYQDRLPVYVQEVSTYPGAAADGSDDEVYEAEGYILSMSKEAPDNDAATWEMEVTLNEPLTLRVPPAAPAAP
ncbi:hypothetical protein GBA65_14905 [Rubrobacter marinus]|uniref:Uncharacterized protein n=1 Tax=Rubrobacter marinus TaxID=2653852 RepID=A0A6G8PZG3_9ACTN|nr:phage tail tube protein [Rubrobacter marinus]QIN79596.1 hypothetical protein GBA65_14905 [Rubrobacter marinus]